MKNSYTSVYAYEELFFQNAISAIPKKMISIIQLSLLTFWKRAVHVYKYLRVNIYIYMMNAFPKHELQTCHLHFKLSFWNGAYHVLQMLFILKKHMMHLCEWPLVYTHTSLYDSNCSNHISCTYCSGPPLPLSGTARP